ncbi:unnamed protein product [Lampetra planeri]
MNPMAGLSRALGDEAAIAGLSGSDGKSPESPHGTRPHPPPYTRSACHVRGVATCAWPRVRLNGGAQSALERAGEATGFVVGEGRCADRWEINSGGRAGGSRVTRPRRCPAARVGAPVSRDLSDYAALVAETRRRRRGPRAQRHGGKIANEKSPRL